MLEQKSYPINITRLNALKGWGTSSSRVDSDLSGGSVASGDRPQQKHPQKYYELYNKFMSVRLLLFGGSICLLVVLKIAFTPQSPEFLESIKITATVCIISSREIAYPRQEIPVSLRWQKVTLIASLCLPLLSYIIRTIRLFALLSVTIIISDLPVLVMIGYYLIISGKIWWVKSHKKLKARQT